MTHGVLGDLGYQDWSKDIAEHLEWEHVEPSSCDIVEWFQNENDSDDDVLTTRMGYVWYEILHLNALLLRQFVFEFVPGFANPVEPVEYYYNDLVAIYGKEPGNESAAVLKELAYLYRRLLMMNFLIDGSFHFSIRGRSELEREYELYNDLVKPAEINYDNYRCHRIFGEDFLTFITRTTREGGCKQ